MSLGQFHSFRPGVFPLRRLQGIRSERLPLDLLYHVPAALIASRNPTTRFDVAVSRFKLACVAPLSMGLKYTDTMSREDIRQRVLYRGIS